MTHDDLVQRAVKWLYSHGCGFAVGEISCANTSGEIPDAIGFKGNQSILIECKTSRADFLADKKKEFRKFPKEGMGNLRLFMCEEGIIKEEDLPNKWGLLYVKGKTVKKIVFPKGNISYGDFWQEKSYQSEHDLMYSCLRRSVKKK
jgi:hypothetical protein